MIINREQISCFLHLFFIENMSHLSQSFAAPPVHICVSLFPLSFSISISNILFSIFFSNNSKTTQLQQPNSLQRIDPHFLYNFFLKSYVCYIPTELLKRFMLVSPLFMVYLSVHYLPT